MSIAKAIDDLIQALPDDHKGAIPAAQVMFKSGAALTGSLRKHERGLYVLHGVGTRGPNDTTPSFSTQSYIDPEQVACVTVLKPLEESNLIQGPNGAGRIIAPSRQ